MRVDSVVLSHHDIVMGAGEPHRASLKMIRFSVLTYDEGHFFRSWTHQLECLEDTADSEVFSQGECVYFDDQKNKKDTSSPSLCPTTK